MKSSVVQFELSHNSAFTLIHSVNDLYTEELDTMFDKLCFSRMHCYVVNTVQTKVQRSVFKSRDPRLRRLDILYETSNLQSSTASSALATSRI